MSLQTRYLSCVAVNIDAKLISNPMNVDGRNNSNAVGKGSSGTVELQNGCAW